MPRITILLLVLVLSLVACGGGGGDDAGGVTTSGAVDSIVAGDVGEPTAEIPPDAFAVRASSDIGTGEERLLLGIATPDGTRLQIPDASVEIAVSPQADPSRVQTAAGIWTEIVPGGTGLFRATFDFDEPGVWVATLTPDGGEPLDPVLFDVLADPIAPALGEVAPAAPTPTLDDLPIEELTTDSEPDTAFYQMTIEEAVATGDPTVLVFSTPAYCQTASCGPLLENVKSIAPDNPDTNFIHIEVYTGLTEPDFAPDAAHLAPAAGAEWYSLPSEPWVFVIDGDGNIAARFEGVMATEELEQALASV